MYKITSVGTRNNGWYHISHPVYGFIKQVRGYSNAIQQVAFLEPHPHTPKRKTKMQFNSDNYFQSMINKETTT